MNMKIEEIKKMSLTDVAFSFGWKINKSKTSKKHIVLISNDKEIVVSKRANGLDQFFLRGTNIRGTVIDFLIEVENYSREEAFCYPDISFHSPPRQSVQPAENKELDRESYLIIYKEAKEKWEKIPKTKSIGLTYLENTRGLSDFQRTKFKGVKETEISVSFPLIELQKGVEIRNNLNSSDFKISSILTYRKFKGIEKTSIKRMLYGFPKNGLVYCAYNENSYNENSLGKIIIGESPIDCLSYAQLHNLKAFTILATSGEPSEEQFKELKKWQNVKNKIIVIDNGKAGERIGNKIMSFVGSADHKTKIVAPINKAKDFNEMINFKSKLNFKKKIKSFKM